MMALCYAVHWGPCCTVYSSRGATAMLFVVLPAVFPSEEGQLLAQLLSLFRFTRGLMVPAAWSSSTALLLVPTTAGACRWCLAAVCSRCPSWVLPPRCHPSPGRVLHPTAPPFAISPGYPRTGLGSLLTSAKSAPFGTCAYTMARMPAPTLGGVAVWVRSEAWVASRTRVLCESQTTSKRMCTRRVGRASQHMWRGVATSPPLTWSLRLSGALSSAVGRRDGENVGCTGVSGNRA